MKLISQRKTKKWERKLTKFRAKKFPHKKPRMQERGGGEKTGKKHKKSLFIGLGIAAPLIVWFFLFSQFFHISSIEVSGASVYNSELVKTLVWQYINTHQNFLFSEKNIFCLSKKDLSLELQNTLFIDDLKISKRPFHTVHITLVEKQPHVTWKTGEQHYTLDSQGVALEEITVTNVALQTLAEPSSEEEEGKLTSPQPELLIDDSRLNKNLPFIIDESAGTVVLGEKVLTENIISYVKAVHQALLNETSDLHITHFSMTQPTFTELKMHTDKGFYVYLESNTNAKEQIDKLLLILREKVNNSGKQIEYIDLRDENTVYIK